MEDEFNSIEKNLIKSLKMEYYSYFIGSKGI